MSLHSLVGASLIVMGGVIASKVLGLGRNVVIGHQFGTSREYELFLAAIAVPDTVFQVLAGGAVGSAFIPVFTAYWERGQRSEAWRLTSGLANLSVVAIGAAALFLTLLAPLLVPILVPGWAPDEQARTAGLVRMMLVSPVVFAVSTLATSALNSVNRFALAAAAPLMYNLALCVGALALRPLGAEGLAISAVVGAFLHLAVQLPGLARVGMRYSLTLGLRLAGTRDVAQLMGPRMIGLGVSQLNQLVAVALASFLGEGSVAYLSYAWLVLMLPLGVVAMGISTAMFPSLARQVAAGRTTEAQETFQLGLRLILFASLPAAAGMIVLARPLVGLLLERGAFGPEAATATAFALALYALGLPGHATIEIASRAFYAVRDTATPVRIAGAAAALNVGLSLLLMRTPFGFGGLALANALAASVEAMVLLALLHQRLGWLRSREFFGFFWRIAAGAAVLTVAAGTASSLLAASVNAGHWTGQLALLAGGGAAGAFAFGAGSLVLGIDEPRRLLHQLRRSE